MTHPLDQPPPDTPDDYAARLQMERDKCIEGDEPVRTIAECERDIRIAQKRRDVESAKVVEAWKAERKERRT